MTLKEQSQAVQLLRRFYERSKALPRELLGPKEIQLLDEAEHFLNHGDDEPQPESHGERRR